MKIYVACLASYNNGRLHGKWIDASSDVESMQEEVNAILKSSPYPNVMRADYHCAECDTPQTVTHSFGEEFTATVECKECGYPAFLKVEPNNPYRSAEEYAIHDFENLPSSFGEYCGLQTIADYVELAEEFDHIDESHMLAIYDEFRDIKEMREAMKEQFVGIYDAFRDYADECADEMLSAHNIKNDNPLSQYFDYESYARDIKHDMRVVELGIGDGVAVFHA